MKRKLIFLSTFLLISSSLFSQKLRTQNESVFTDKKIKLILPPAFMSFEKGDTYAFDIPLEVKRADEYFEPFYIAGQKNARPVRMSKNPKYIFYLTASPRVEIEKNVKFLELKKIDRQRKFEHPDRYAGVISFPFGFKIKITDQQGNTLKEVVLHDKSQEKIYYIRSGQYKEKACALPTSYLRNTEVGYETPEEARAAFNNWLRMSDSNLHHTACVYARKRADKILKMLFLESTPKHRLFIKTIAKKDKNNYPDLDKELEEFKLLCQNWIKDRKDSKNLERIGEFTDLFLSRISETEDKNLQTLYQLNAGIGELMREDFKTALGLLGNGIQNESNMSNLRNSIESFYEIFSTYHDLTREGETIYALDDYNIYRDYNENFEN